MIWLAALALGFLGTAEFESDAGANAQVSGFQAHSSSESPEGMISSFLEILLQSSGFSRAGWGRAGQGGAEQAGQGGAG